ncbi:MAG TPA: DUF2927 domain-containing protein [Gemmatimonadales bacterium]
MNSSTWCRLGLALLAAGCSTGTPVTEPPLPPGDPGESSAYYSEAELAVFATLAFSGNTAARMRRWDQPIRIRIEGEYTPEDSAVVVEVAAKLSEALVTIPVSVVQGNATVELYFMPDTAYYRLRGSACSPPGGVWGYSCPTWDADRRYTAVAVYVTSLRTAPIRRYLIHHELMHMVGFYDHPANVASILSRPENTSQSTYLPLDYLLLEMMGREELRPGMLGDEALTILRGLKRRPASQ